jgi:hypothetical protein
MRNEKFSDRVTTVFVTIWNSNSTIAFTMPFIIIILKAIILGETLESKMIPYPFAEL